VVEQFTQTMQSSVLDDNIHVTATSPIHETQGNDTTVAIHAENNTAPLGSNEILVHHEPIVNINQNIATPDEGEQKHYYAQLIGFGTEKAAEQFVKRLASNGVTTEIKKRVSKTVKGRTSYWYQVVTTAYANKDDLSRIVDKLVKEEKLKDVCIRTC
jgi:cell division protein FtsN